MIKFFRFLNGFDGGEIKGRKPTFKVKEPIHQNRMGGQL